MDLWRVYVNVCDVFIELAAYQEDSSFELS